MSRFSSTHLGRFSQVIPDHKPTTVNAEGHAAYKESTIREAIARLALTGVLGNQFYRKEDDIAKELVEVVRKGALEDPLYLLKAAHVSRKNDLKLFPKLAIAAVLARNDLKPATRELIEDVAVKVLSTYNPGQLLEFVETIKEKVFGAGLGRRERRVINKVIEGWKTTRLESYTLSEYASMNQLFRITHPSLGNSPAVKYLFTGTPGTTRQFALKTFKESEAGVVRAELIRQHRLPFNTVKGLVANSDKISWSAIMDQMSPLALLLNLRALDEKGVITPAILASKLGEVDTDTVRLLPFDIIRPVEHADQKYREVLLTFMGGLVSKPIPALQEATLGVLLDGSGSMNGMPWLTACSLIAPILSNCKNRHFQIFNSQVLPEGTGRVPYLKDSGKVGILHNLLNAFPSGSTNTALAIKYYIDNRINVDCLVLATDEQENGRGSAYQIWREYRRTVNKDAKLLVINCTNNPWHLAPDMDDSIVIIQTMTPKIYSYIANLKKDVVQVIQDTNLEDVVDSE